MKLQSRLCKGGRKRYEKRRRGAVLLLHLRSRLLSVSSGEDSEHCAQTIRVTQRAEYVVCGPGRISLVRAHKLKNEVGNVIAASV